jgi:hypothetical protein
MKRLALILISLLGAFQVWAVEEISVALNRDARFVVTEGSEPNGQLDLVVAGKTVWSATPGYGTAKGTEVSWSPHSTKAALSIRGTKSTSSIHILDVSEQQKELRIPDLASVVRALNGGNMGRAFLMTPAGWADDDHVLVRVYGNLVDWGGTDGQDDLNFSYVFVIELSTQRVLSVTCTSKHNLNSKELIEQGRGANALPRAAHD